MLGLAIPAVATLVADPLLGLVDTAVVGRLGAAELGALGLAVSVLGAVSWIFNFLVFGTTSTVARAVGAGDPEAAGRRVSHAVQVGLAIGVVVGAVLFVAAGPLLRALGTVEELLPPAVVYLQVRAVGVPLLLLTYVGHGAFRGVSDTRTPMGIVVAANVVNAVLTVVLVFPVGLGIAGAAWATVVAEALTAGALLLRLRRTGLPLIGHGRPDRTQLAALVVVSRDLFLRTGGLLAGLLAVTAAAGRTGAVTAAGHQVLYQTFLLVSFLMDGFAIAAQAIVGTALGAGRIEEARAYGRDLVRWGVGGGAVIAALLLAGGGVLPRLLTDDPTVLAVIATAWWFAALGHVVNGPVFALDGVLMGAEDFAYLRTWTVLAALVGGLGGQLVATFGGGLLGLWVAVQAMMLVRLVSLVARVRGTAWTRTGAGLVVEP
ncbi:MATE family efflux transporter [Egicoccus halophilus]|uniref:MATE family efflux transporter n=1 Tax=Egicoccus halophilus TaxID=1670830 RepID=A0A8J3EXF0_9ACTN|nr:MATE family efflux transporter [Egicoccus halophilus]GGI05625.1 MATE family efflux transporter [Egicoccus halophilus]